MQGKDGNDKILKENLKKDTRYNIKERRHNKNPVMKRIEGKTAKIKMQVGIGKDNIKNPYKGKTAMMKS